ncbi:diphthine--ammonia ligase [Glugoides intestinalis]
MKFLALVSGGKDSIYTICKLIDEGHTLAALVHIKAKEEYTDSYMYQTVGSEAALLLGECFGVPIFSFTSNCKAVNKSLEYSENADDEVETIYEAISHVLKTIDIEAVSSGALCSTYQKNRIENVCSRFGLISLNPLWMRDQRELLDEMISYGIKAKIVKVASSLLSKECLNMSLVEIKEYLNKKNSKYDMNYCGEGGEYESIVLDCKYFKKKIQYDSFEIYNHPEERNKDDGVYFMRMKGIHLLLK